MTKDPVCGRDVDDEQPPAKSSSGGQSYAFCGNECKEKFDKNPVLYSRVPPTKHSFLIEFCG